MDKEVGSVVKLIFDSMESVGPNTGTLGDVFQDFLNKSLQEQKDQDPNSEDLIFESKMKFLKQCEVDRDLGWFDYDSWNSIPKPLQDKFLAQIEHLFYGGVFFQYSKLVAIEKELWKELPVTHNITVLRDCNNYRLVCIGQEDNKYGRLGVMAMSKVQKEFETKTIRSIATNSNGEVIEKVRESSGS